MSLDLTKNPFFSFTRIEEKEVESELIGVPKQIELVEFKDGFNLSQVLRWMELREDGKRAIVVVINDWHEEKVPFYVTKNGKKEINYEKRFVASRALIEKAEDIERFFQLIGV